MENIKRIGEALHINLYKKELVAPSVRTQKEEFQQFEALSAQVSISSEGQDKLKQERSQSTLTQSNMGQEAGKVKMELGQSVAKKLHDNAIDNAEKEEEKDILDKMIDELKEKIEEITLQLKEIGSDESEQTLEQKELLGNQLIVLSGQLLTLMAEKLKQGSQTAQLD